MRPKIWRESFFILTLFLLMALPAFWQLASPLPQSTPDQPVQAHVLFPKEERALASLGSGGGSKNCVLRQKTKSLCGQVKGDVSCPQPQVVSYWHCQAGDSHP